MSTDKLKILYAEDDKDVAESVSRAISLSPNIDIIDIANDGEELIDLYENNKGKYDILISDIQMPKISGIDAIKKIKEYEPSIFTIITTAYNDNNYLFKAIHLNIDKYFLKPLDLRELINIIDSFSENKRIKGEHSFQKEMLLVQSKAASMGYMMDAVAHQWKQPLSMISLLNSTIRYQLDNDMVDKEKLKNFTCDIDKAIDHMSDTLGEFRTFMRPDKVKVDFSIKECLEKVEDIIKYDLTKKRVELFLNTENDFIIHGFTNQFIHIILNFISNSIDAFEDNQIKNREVKISLFEDTKKKSIIYKDTAGGIPKNIIDKVFDLNFTTKSLDKGTGVGLYLSKQIAMNHDATISLENIDNGVQFSVDIKV